jgi:hypothetical protein
MTEHPSCIGCDLRVDGLFVKIKKEKAYTYRLMKNKIFAEYQIKHTLRAIAGILTPLMHMLRMGVIDTYL